MSEVVAAPRVKRVRTFLFCGLLVAFPFFRPVLAQQKDTLHFYNTSMLMGELLSIKLGRVEFDADGVGIVKIKNKEIRTIHAQSNEYRIETTDGLLLQGYLRSSDKPGSVLVQSTVETKEIDLAGITSLVKYSRSWSQGLNGSVGAGYTYTKSSELGRLNFDGSVKYSAPKTETKLTVSFILTSDSVALSREREDVNLGFNYTFKSLWTVGGALRYQRNLELGLDRRWQEGVRVGYKLLVKRSQQALVLTGMAFNQERNLEGVNVNNTEVILQATYDLFSFEEPNLIISAVQTGYFSVTQSGRVRYDGDVSFNWELISDFYLNFQFYHNYDTRSPETNEPNIDYGVVVGFNYKF